MRIDWAGPRLATSALTAAIATGTTSLLGATTALAQTGQPAPWQMNMQTAVTDNMLFITSFHNWLVVLITLISLFVLALLVYVIYRFNEKANPVPSKTSHNTLIEVAWTVIPILILVAIAVPSFRLLRHQLVIPAPDLVVKATGHSWYWSYEYPAVEGQGGFTFDSNLIDEKDLKPGQPRLLAVDNEVVVPVGKIVKLQVTAADVLHAFAMPSFGLKIDAIPGRLNETWFKADREGVYYGQCSELCGVRHAYMPIAIRVVSQDQYNAWVAEAKQRFASTDGDVKLAAGTR